MRLSPRARKSQGRSKVQKEGRATEESDGHNGEMDIGEGRKLSKLDRGLKMEAM